MNKEETKQAIEVMQAFVDDAEIQVRAIVEEPLNFGFWIDFAADREPSWKFSTHEYRIKPKPREFWIARYPDNEVSPFVVYDGSGPPTPIRNDWIKVREILND